MSWNVDVTSNNQWHLAGLAWISGNEWGFAEQTHNISWKGLWDKNSDKLYAPDQLLPEGESKSKHKSKYDAQMQRFGDLYEQAKKVMKFNN